MSMNLSYTSWLMETKLKSEHQYRIKSLCTLPLTKLSSYYLKLFIICLLTYGWAVMEITVDHQMKKWSVSMISRLRPYQVVRYTLM